VGFCKGEANSGPNEGLAVKKKIVLHFVYLSQSIHVNEASEETVVFLEF
jgi:hypothetical protein